MCVPTPKVAAVATVVAAELGMLQLVVPLLLARMLVLVHVEVDVAALVWVEAEKVLLVKAGGVEAAKSVRVPEFRVLNLNST